MKRMYLLLVLLATAWMRADVAFTRGDVAFASDDAALARSNAALVRVQDPLVVNSKTIALKLENARVRVLEATLKPGDKEALHSHPAYVIYVIEGGKVRTHGLDGSVVEADFKTGDVIYREPVTHWAENVGKTTMRLELVELKQ